MKNKLLPFIVFLTGIAISTVAAYYSIIGLTTIFAGAFWSIVIMGTVLEIGKIVAVSWLYNNWNVAPLLIKTYLTSAVIVLMLITSMGIFGLLSKYHIDQQVSINTGAYEQIQIIDSKIKIHADAISELDRQITQINNAIEKIAEKGTGQAALNASNQQRRTRDDLIKRKQEEIRLQSDLRIQKIKLESENKKIEAELGPIKYVAELIYGSSDANVVDKSIRLVIILIILTFDPLAILLLIAFNISITKDDVPEFVEIDIKEDKPKRKEKKLYKKKVTTLPV